MEGLFKWAFAAVLPNLPQAIFAAIIIIWGARILYRLGE